MDWFGFCSPQKDGCCPGICDPGRQVSLRLSPLLQATVAYRQGPRHGVMVLECGRKPSRCQTAPRHFLRYRCCCGVPNCELSNRRCIL
jgi:hypothetical protein